MESLEDVKRCREISDQLKKLGVPEKTMALIDEWIEGQERLHDEFLKTTNPIERMLR